MTSQAVQAKGSSASPALVRILAVGVFLGGSAAAIYAPSAGSTAVGVLALAALLLFYVACGAAIGRWWAMLLPLLVVLIAIPSNADSDVPYWADYLFFLAVPAALLLGLGVLLGRIVRSRYRSRLPGLLQS